MAISIRLPGDVEARLQNLAALTGRSKTFYVTEAILEHLDDLEDLSAAIRWTRSLVVASTFGSPRSARDTVAVETPAASATSLMVMATTSS